MSVRTTLVCCLAVVSVFATAVRAETLRLTIDDAVSRATANNLELRINRYDIDVSKANVERSSAWLPSNPYLSFGFARHTQAGGVPSYYGSLSQEFEIAGQRALRMDSAQHGQGRQSSEIKSAEAGVVAATKTAFVRAQINGQRVTLAHRGLDIANDLVRQLAEDLPTGGAERIELNAARIQEERSRRDLADAEQARDDSLDTLRRALDIPLDQTVELVGVPQSKPTPLPALADLITRAKQRRPDVVALHHAAQAAETDLHLAKRERIPNVTLSGSVSHYESSTSGTGDSVTRFEGNTYGGGDIGFAIPVFQTKSGDIQEAVAERNRAADQIKNLEDELEMEIRAAYRACTVAGKDVEAHERTIVPLSEENVQIEQRLFDRDEVGASDLIGQQIDLLTARRAQLDAIENFNTACIELERVVGEPLYGSAADTSR